MRESKNALLFTGIWIYVLYGIYDFLFRIPHSYTSDIQPLYSYIVLSAIFSAIAYIVLPVFLLVLNLKNKSNKLFSIAVAIFSIISAIMVAIKFDPILSYLIISKLGLIDTYWQYLFFEILPKRGLVGIISFILITIGAILSIKKKNS